MINWKVRLKNKGFWLSIIPASILFIQAVAGAFGYKLDLDGVGENLLNVVNTGFAVLALLGIVTDPTTEGVGDSAQALSYEEPKKKTVDD